MAKEFNENATVEGRNSLTTETYKTYLDDTILKDNIYGWRHACTEKH